MTEGAEGGLLWAVRRGLALWPVSPDSEVRLLNRSENTVFRIDDPAGRCLALRAHRPGYNSRAAIASELAWIAALRRQEAVATPAPVAGRDGALVQSLESALGQHHAVAFEFVAGAEPAGDMARWFGALGRITAQLHAHAREWVRPGWFERRRWDFSAMFGPEAVWGSWRSAGVGPAGTEVLARGEALIGRRLAAFGQEPDRFGLIHADLRLTNLLADGERLQVIDFDDCGFGWLAYDFAAAVSFFEDAPEVPALLDAWLEGYRAVRAFPAEQAAEMPVFVAARRLLLTAWVASHADVAPVGAGYAAGTVALLEEVLRRFG